MDSAEEIRSHRDLQVWQLAMDLAQSVYGLTAGFPKQEEYRITSQIIRAAISIPANIAEGNARGTRKDYAHFISIARGSAAELETLLVLAQRSGFVSELELAPLLEMNERIGRMLTSLRKRLSQSPPQSPIPNP
ncbi:MAG: four helix bundle protein [Parvularculaceae bacterium]